MHLFKVKIIYIFYKFVSIFFIEKNLKQNKQKIHKIIK